MKPTTKYTGIVTFILLAVLVLAYQARFFTGQGNRMAEPELRELFIYDQIGDYTVSSGSSGYCQRVNDPLYSAVLYECRISYKNKSNPFAELSPGVSKSASKSAGSFIVYVLHLDKKSDYQYEYYREVIARNQTGYEYEIYSLPKNSLNIIHFILNVSDKETYYWLHKDKIIRIDSSLGKLPEEALSAYLEKYPPTLTLDKNELDPEAITKRHLLTTTMANIHRAEKETRQGAILSPPRVKQYIGAMSQCKWEIIAKCQVGIINGPEEADCPIAKTMDEEERTAKWRQLQEEIQKRSVLIDRVDWRDHMDCAFSYNEAMRANGAEIEEALGVTDKDLMKIHRMFISP